MASDAPELDLYADDIGDEFAQEYNDNDLYDDVLTSNSKQRNNSNEDQQQFNGGGVGGNSNQSQNSSQNSQQTNNNNNNSFSSNNTNLVNTNQTSNELNHTGSVRKPCIYVGNLTWWTTDEDVIKSLNNINVNDVIEVKFFENRANGQSKGFCVVTMQSDVSVRIALEKLKLSSIHNQNPIVTLCNRQNLNNFEMKSRKPGLNGQPNNQNNNNFMQNNRNFNQNQNMQPGPRPPLIQRPMRPNGPLLNSQPPRLPTMSHQAMPYGGNAQQWNQMMPNGPRNNPMQAGANQLNPMLRLNQGNRQLSNQPLLSAPANQVDLRTQLSSVTGMAGVQHPMSAAHTLFSSQSALVPPTSDMFTNRMATMGAFGPANDFARPTMDHMAMQMSEAEFEEILTKNKNLAHNAISRALSDAASGDISAAIDTITTAISLIKGSRVAHDERCKITISLLQDTLQSIEQKSFSMGSDRGGSSSMRNKDRIPRSRSRDRDRGSSSHRSGGSGRDKDRRRDRSRSRDRDYRERSRDRYHEDHRSYHEDRYRDKDRDRDHGRGRH